MNTYLITTPRLLLRQWQPSDVAPYPKLLTEEETEAMVERIKTHFDKYGFGLFAVEHKGTKEFIGYTGFMVPAFESFFTPCIEIGWRYKKEVWGQGFATEAAIACLHYGFETLGFEKVFSFTAVINISSEKVMKRIGMAHIGYFDHPKVEKSSVLCRHVLYQITKEEFYTFSASQYIHKYGKDMGLL